MKSFMTEEDEVLRQLTKAKEQVSYILEHFPNARNNDFYLQILWLRIFGRLKDKLPYIEYSDIRRLSGRLETVRRVRQKIQNEEGKFLPTDPEIIIKRRQREQKMREAIRKL